MTINIDIMMNYVAIYFLKISFSNIFSLQLRTLIETASLMLKLYTVYMKSLKL